MAWKASSTPLFVVWVLQKHGNLARPAQHTTPTFLFLTASTFHVFHKQNLQKSMLIGTCGTITCPPSVAQDNPAGTFQYDVLWCCEISSLMQMALKKWPNKAEIGGWNLCLWQKHFCILHLRSSHLRSLNTKKGFKEKKRKDFFPSEHLVPKLWWQSVHNYLQNIRETSLFQHCCKTAFMGSQLLGSKNHLPSRLEVSSMANSAFFLGKYRRK